MFFKTRKQNSIASEDEYRIACGKIRENNCGENKKWGSFSAFDREMLQMGFQRFYLHCKKLGLDSIPDIESKNN